MDINYIYLGIGSILCFAGCPYRIIDNFYEYLTEHFLKFMSAKFDRTHTLRNS